MSANSDKDWALVLFQKSVLKQDKWRQITALLGKTDSLRCLDIGSGNGVISYLLRKRGGYWKSADLNEEAVLSARGLVESYVYKIDGERTEFQENEFDRIVIVDFLEHVPTDREFLAELFRIMDAGGELIINVPHRKDTFLRRLRSALGQTDEKHGHVRSGYTVDTIREVLGTRFHLIASKTYSKFFSEFIDTVIGFCYGVLTRRNRKGGHTGNIVTGKDLGHYQKQFKVYSMIYPLVWLFSKLDALLFFCSGYMLIVKARVNKEVFC